MEIMYKLCSSCAGMGHQTVHVPNKSEENNESMKTWNTFHAKRIMCKACNGKGCEEYAVFSIEEAKAILEHCGLSTEGAD